jgi:cytochrome P450
VSKAFTVGRIEALRPRVQDIADELVADFLPRGEAELLGEPKHCAALRADPDLLPAAVGEMLRYDGPVELAVSRYTTAPVTVGEVTIPG